MHNHKLIAVSYALLAAIFYSLNVPFSKILLTHIDPTLLASLLYFGAGLGVGLIYLFHYKQETKEDHLNKNDLPYTIAMVILDIMAPIFLMLGIKLSTAANATLLGNFEIVATSLIALFIFKEDISKKLWWAIGFITLSSIILSFEGNGSFTFSYGSLLVILATLCWGIENNCTRSISDKSTYEIVTIKGLGSGLGSLIVSLIIGVSLPQTKYILSAMLLGFFAYGLSIFTYIRAQKNLGAAKTSAYYATAPFISAFLAFLINQERLNFTYFIALLIMVIGTYFVIEDTLATNHQHFHAHTITHTHDGTTHTHVINHEHHHHHFASDDKHRHDHDDYLNSAEHLAAHAIDNHH